MTFTQGHLGEVKVTVEKSEKFVFGPYLSQGDTHWKFLLHTKITCDLRMSHDFDPKSFGQVQDHWKENIIICPVYTFLTEKH